MAVELLKNPPPCGIPEIGQAMAIKFPRKRVERFAEERPNRAPHGVFQQLRCPYFPLRLRLFVDCTSETSTG